MQKTTKCHVFIYGLLIVFTLILSKNVKAQVIWHETFDVPEKGYWADSQGNLHHDLAGIKWTLDVSNCEFSDANDYAKTVSTSGGRFEVLDSDGEAVWISEEINISGYDLINISLDASETGSGSNVNNKYIKAFFVIDGQSEEPFSPEHIAAGDWGSTTLKQKALQGSSLRIVVRLNSSYANDKLILDNIFVEAIDSSMITPSRIQIMESPFFAFTNDSLLLSAAAVNEIGDVIADSTIELRLNSPYFFSEPVGYDDGVYSWKAISNITGKLDYSISVVDGNLSWADSSVYFFEKSDILLDETFEAQIEQDWILGTNWEISEVGPISGNRSIKHVRQDAGGTSELIYSGQEFYLNEKEFLFSFKIKNGNWDPTNANLFYFWLESQGNNANPDGYAIGVNATGSDDLVSIWKMKDGKPVELLASTGFDWEANHSAQVFCIRSATGEWLIGATDLLNGNTKIATMVDKEFVMIHNIRLVFTFTTTRSGELWFDDVVVVGQDAPPYILNAYPNADGTISVIFSEAIQMALLSTASFNLRGESGASYVIKDVVTVSSSHVKLVADPIVEPNLILSVYQLQDAQGQLSRQIVFPFEYSQPAVPFDIVISEIMADPNPPVGLPEAEYIEVYNRSNKFIQLENWTLFVRNTHYKIPKKLIKPGEYIVLCDENFASSYKYRENLAIFNRFPALLNAGTLLQMVNPDGVVIDQLTYSDKWYNNNVKARGGYSLERIDLERFCHQAQNWTASNHESGGTPGMENSVKTHNPDSEPPVLLAVSVINYSQLEVLFDEPLDSIRATRVANYALPNLQIASVQYLPGETRTVIILRSPLKINTNYQLTVNNMADECGNLSPEMTVAFSKAELVKGDILITEVLFNPYTHGVDFVELYNNSGLTVDLKNLKLANRDDSLNLKPVYDITSRHSRFFDKTYRVVTVDPENIMQFYHVPFPENIYRADRLPAYNNEKGRVVLLSDSMVILDEMAYHEKMHSPWVRDVNGISLERLSLTVDASQPTNWQSASSTVGYATPGYKNSQSAIDEGQKIGIELEWDVVSPNGDGFRDELIITFNLDQPGYLANVFIFNANGAEVKRIMNNSLIGNLNQVVYNIRDNRNALLPMGTYVIFAELIHFDSPKQVFKTAFHVTDRR